ncbi:MAG: hypothetical protein ABW000_07315 [Actinoplanes sp.]
MDLDWMDFGNVPDWLAAFGTTGGLIFFGVQLKRDRHKDRKSAAAEIAAAHDSEANQARLVTVAWSWSYLEDDRGGESRYHVHVDVVNDSSAPIRHLDVVIEKRTSLLPGPAFERSVGSRLMFLSPGESHRMTVAPDDPPQKPEMFWPDSDGDLEASHWVGVQFTDAAGLRWFQSPHGQPMRQIYLPA